MADEYFASLETEKVGPEIFARIENFYEYLRTSGRLNLYKRSYDYYFQAVKTGGRVYQTGDEGEFTNVDLADYRNILQHLKVMTTSTRPTFEPKATNSDHKSMSQTILANGLLEYYLREKKLERFGDLATEYALRYGDGYVELDWNATAGAAYVLDENGNEIKEGDLEAYAYGPLDVILDYTRNGSLECDWRITRRFKNKYDIAEKYAPKKMENGRDKNQDLREKILSCSTSEDAKQFMFGTPRHEESDLIPVYTLHHRRTESVPNGRLVRLVSPDAILTDGPLPFKNITLFRIAAGDQDGTPFGYSVAFDLLPLQQTINALVSTISTNAATFGVQNIAAPKGHGLTISQIVEGLNLLEYDAQFGKPEALNLLSIPAEIFKFVDQVRNMMEVVAGLTSVTRGTPEASLKSGAALALVQSMAIQFNSNLQQSYAQLLEDIGTGIVEILQNFATTKRVASIAGKSNRSLMREWSGQDLDQISRVTVDLGNPLSRTTAGRVNMAEALLGAQMIENPQQYLQVLQTGRLDPMIEGKTSELLNIKSENERISNGDVPTVVMTDKHPLHIQEHKPVMDSPESREDPSVVNAWTNHIQQHFEIWRSTPPELLGVLGLQPIPPQQMPMAPQGPGPVPPEGPQGTGQAPEGIDQTLAPPQPGSPSPRMAQPPTNPLTGEKFNVDTGGVL